MNELERTLIEYRPDIRYETQIRNEVERKLFVKPGEANKADIPYKYHKTPIMQELDMYSPVTAITEIQKLIEDKVMLNDIKEQLENEIKDNPVDEDGNRIPNDSIENGVPGGILDIIEKIEEQIEYIEDQVEYFYDIKVDEDDLDKFKEEQQDRIDKWKDRERDELSSIVDYEFSPIEKEYIESLIHNPESDVNSYDEYIQQLLRDRINAGSPYINYAEMSDEIKVAYLLEAEIGQIRSAIHGVDTTYNYNMNDAMLGATQKGLEFLVEASGQLFAVKEVSNLQYNKETRDTITVADNMVRHNDIKFRYALFNHLKVGKDLRNRYRGNWLTTKSVAENEASVAFATTLKNGESMIDSNWENNVVEMLGSSQTLYKQLEARLNSVQNRKHHSLLYRFADIVSREFDFEYKERELKTFVRRFNLDSMR